MIAQICKCCGLKTDKYETLKACNIALLTNILVCDMLNQNENGGFTMGAEEKKTKAKSKEYPAVTLGQAIEFVGKFRDYPQGKAVSYDTAAKECEISASTKSFRYTISSAKQFGLISTSTGQTFTLLEPAYRLIRPTESESSLHALKIECFSAPKLYSELIPMYVGKSLPPVTTLENVLVNYHHIVPAVAKSAAQKFIDSATEIGIVQNGVLNLEVEGAAETTEGKESDSAGQVLDTRREKLPDVIPSEETSEFAAPLNISFGDKRRAVLYMPIDASKEDAEYVRDMISLMFKRVYEVD